MNIGRKKAGGSSAGIYISKYMGVPMVLAVSCFGENPSLTKDLCKKLDEEFLEDK